jgi:hypothetical protein
MAKRYTVKERKVYDVIDNDLRKKGGKGETGAVNTARSKAEAVEIAAAMEEQHNAPKEVEQ